MIVQFSVKNYKSIKDEVTINFQGKNITEKEESLLSINKEDKLLPLIALYGPNGSGKTNILEALALLIEKVRTPMSFSLSLNDEGNMNVRSHSPLKVTPYKFNEEAKEKPTHFFLSFRTKMGEYRYTLNILNNKIVYESFSRIKNETNRLSLLFEREGEYIKLGTEFTRFSNPECISSELPLLSFLGFSYKKNEIVRDYVSFFLNNFRFLDFSYPLNEEEVYNIISKNNIKNLFLESLKELDIDIKDFRYSVLDNTIYTTHINNGYKSELTFKEESKGVRKIFETLPFILLSLINGSVIVIDDLDTFLHPLLLKHIIGMFSNPLINKNKAQLIFSSHNLAILNNESFRRDEVYFTSKGKEENTYFFSLIDVKDENNKVIRKDARYDKQYLEGRYGAIPKIKKIEKE